MAKDKKKPVSPSDDLINREALPDVPTIKPGAGFGDDIKKAPKKPGGKAGGGVIKSSASKRADGCAVRGKTRGRIV